MGTRRHAARRSRKRACSTQSNSKPASRIALNVKTTVSNDASAKGRHSALPRCTVAFTCELALSGASAREHSGMRIEQGNVLDRGGILRKIRRGPGADVKNILVRWLE